MSRVIIFIIIIASYSIQTQAADYTFIAEDRSVITKFCIAAAEDNLDGLRRAIRKMSPSPHQKHKTVINSVRCNGQVAAHFAQTHMATETFGYLYKFTEKRNKKTIPYTSVEAFVASRDDTKDPGTMIVKVSGSK